MPTGNAGSEIPPQTEMTPARGITMAVEAMLVERKQIINYLSLWVRLAIKNERLVLASELNSIASAIIFGEHWNTEVKQVNNNEELWR